MSDMYFNPVQGLESVIFGSDHAPGTLYFATDTGKMILDTIDNRIVLGNTGADIFYANATNLVSNVNGSFNIFKKYFDDPYALPKVNDLVINKDGRFFRVNSYSMANPEAPFANCTLIAVSGTGSSSGGGGGGGSVSPSDPKAITLTFEPFKRTFIYGSPYTIQFVPKAEYPFLQASYEVFEDRDNQPYLIDEYSIDVDSGSLVDFNMVSRKMEPGKAYKIIISVTGPGLIPRTEEINNVSCIDFKLKPDPNFNNSKYFETDTFMFSVIPEGKIARTLHISVNGIDLPVVNLSATECVDGTTVKEVEINLHNLELPAGVYTIKAYLMAQGVASNEIVTDIIYNPPGSSPATYVILLDTPASCYSYETPQVKYWVYDTSQPPRAEIKIKLSVNGVSKEITQTQENGMPFEPWSISNLEPNIDNYCEIECNKVSRSFSIYCQKSAIYDEETIGALLLLNTKGRSNAVSLEERLKWNYTKGNTTISAQLNGFNWENNGWMSDDTGKSCLRISNGANVAIPISVFSNIATSNTGFTFEFEFKPYNLYSYDLLNKETITEGEDNEVTINRDFDASRGIISYLEPNANNKVNGLCFGTQDAVFRFSNGNHATARYTNDEVMNVAVVLDIVKKQIYIYINGIMSGMSKYTVDSNDFPLGASHIIIDSTHCDIDLYNIRIYQSALSSKQIVQNYVASKQDLSIARANGIAENNTVKLKDLIEYNESRDNADNLTIPYIIFTTKSTTNHLPYDNEKADIFCDISFVNPALDQALTNGEITETEYKNKAPSFKATDIPLNAQGTSSLKYPRKNFKGKFKDALRADDDSKKFGSFQYTHKKLNEKTEPRKKYYIRDNIAETTFTWKADFMDSSSSHNTGFASCAHDLYWNHPLDYYDDRAAADARVGGNRTGSYHQKYRTTLFGFPVLAFHQKGIDSDDIEFIGCYNFNLDKGADRTLGMDLDVAHPVLTNKKYSEVCECWEMANNLGTRCSFRGDPFDAGFEFDEDGHVIGGQSNLGTDIEVRYHKDGDAIEGAWINYDKPIKKGGKPISPQQAYNVLLGDDRTGAYSNLERFYNWLKDCFFVFNLEDAQERAWVESILGRPLEYHNGVLSDNENDDKNPSSYAAMVKARKQKFEEEFEYHLNREYCQMYYVLTEVLLQFDSRGKNMMFASWGPMEEFQTDKDGNFILDADGNKIPGEYIWFPIFYDIDTQLGVNNAGVPSWEYNVEPTTGFNNLDADGKMVPAFSSPTSLLWLNFQACYDIDSLSSPVGKFYQLLRGFNFNINLLNKYYTFGSKSQNLIDENAKDYCRRGVLPESVFNANQYYKYILPSLSVAEGGGYVTGEDSNNSSLSYDTESGYFYCLQGTRALYRKQFLRNRFNYYDSKWKYGAYSPGSLNAQAAYWRVNPSRTPTIEDDIILNVKTDLDQYIVIWLDQQITDDTVVSLYARGGEYTEVLGSKLGLNSSQSQQILNFGGEGHIQEFGHVSELYPDTVDYASPSLVKIDLGSEDVNYAPDQRFSMSTFAGSLGYKPLLKVFDVTNVESNSGTAESFNFAGDTKANKLEEFRALGADVQSVSFPAGGALNKVYLPSIINKLQFLNTPFLNVIRYGENVDETISNCLHLTGIDNVRTIDMSGGNFGQYSYELLEKLINQTKNNPNQDLKINMINVQWSPYIQLGAGAVKSTNEEYYYASDNNTFIPYNRTNSWDNDVLSGKVYKKSSASGPNFATDLSLLDTILSDDTHNIYKNITAGSSSYPNITGEFYVNNPNDDTKITEAELYDNYIQYFPKLSIRLANILNSYKARFVVVENGVETEVYTLRTDDVTTKITPPNNSMLPNISHKEFQGWQDETGAMIAPDAFDKLSFTTKNIHTFYAVYKHVSYDILFTETDDIIEDFKYSQPKTVAYGEILNKHVPTLIPHRPKQEAQLEKQSGILSRYVFVGWTTNKSQGGIAPSKETALHRIEDLLKIKADRDYTFYPVYYKDEDILNNPTDEKYFISEFTPDGSGCILSLRRDYQLTGKITIPATHSPATATSPVPVKVLGNFKSGFEISEIFFQNGSQITTISDQAFERVSASTQPKIKGIYLPDSVTTIGYRAFYKLISLQSISLGTNEDDKVIRSKEMGDNIISIGREAFCGGEGDNMIIELSKLSQNLTTIGAQAFKNCVLMTVSEIPSKLQTIPNAAFAFCQALRVSTIPSSVKKIEQNAFIGYSNGGGSEAQQSISDIYVENRDCEIGQSAFAYYGNYNQSTSKSLVTLWTPNADWVHDDDKAAFIGVQSIELLN